MAMKVTSSVDETPEHALAEKTPLFIWQENQQMTGLLIFKQ